MYAEELERPWFPLDGIGKVNGMGARKSIHAGNGNNFLSFLLVPFQSFADIISGSTDYGVSNNCKKKKKNPNKGVGMELP